MHMTITSSNPYGYLPPVKMTGAMSLMGADQAPALGAPQTTTTLAIAPVSAKGLDLSAALGQLTQVDPKIAEKIAEYQKGLDASAKAAAGPHMDHHGVADPTIAPNHPVRPHMDHHQIAKEALNPPPHADHHGINPTLRSDMNGKVTKVGYRFHGDPLPKPAEVAADPTPSSSFAIADLLLGDAA
jgi:hypothetical protein